MKTTKVSFVIVAFLSGLILFAACKSVRMSFLGVFHFQKQFELTSNSMPTKDSVIEMKDGFYQGAGGPGRIVGCIQSSDSMLVDRVQISLKRIESKTIKSGWVFIRSSQKGYFNIDELPCGIYDMTFVNIGSELLVKRNIMLSDSVPEVKLKIVLNPLN